MKIIEKNIGRHENGNLYFVSRRKGKLNRQSLGTKDLKEARRKIRELGTLALTAAPAPSPEPPVPMPGGAVAEVTGVSQVPVPDPAVPLLTVAEALDKHDRGLVLVSEGFKEDGEASESSD